jgi:hypothetical protein
LSDVPSQNVLKLEIGEVVNIEENDGTFAANIHDLLSHEFFLKDGYMGEHAKHTVQLILDSLNCILLEKEVQRIPKRSAKFKSFDDKIKRLRTRTLLKDKEDLRKYISIIGEPLIKDDLTELFLTVFPITSKRL